MPDMLAAGAAWLTAQLNAAAAATVTYRRGGDEAEISATIGRSDFEAQGQEGVIENWESRDFLIPAASLPFGEPKRGDLIVETSGDLELVYEVSAPRGVPVFRYGDAFRSIVRVHTKQTDDGVELLLTEAGDQLVTETAQPLVL
jgi:hypothetical protein